MRDHWWALLGYLVFFALLLLLVVNNVVVHIREHAPFGFLFWIAPAALLVMAITLIQAYRDRRRAAAARIQSRY